jgi:hypothetical protein
VRLEGERGRGLSLAMVFCFLSACLVCKEMSDSGKFEDKRLQPPQSSCPNPVFHVDSL